MANKIPERIIPHTGQVTQNYGVRHLFEVFYSLSTQTPPGALPLWTGQELYNCKNDYPAFWKKALELKAAGKIRVVSESVYNKEIAAPDISSGKAENAKSFGQTGAFVINEATGYLRLPKITQFIQSIDGASENGIAQLDAIRNITGEFAADNSMIGTALEGSSTGPTGAFEGIEKGNFDIDSHSGNYAGGRLKLDASNVVPIADRVRPRNVQMALYIQVSNPKLNDDELQQAALDRQYIESVKTEINNIKKELQNELILVRNETAISSLPDMSRAVFLEETDYSFNDNGCIFKINVPGWLVPMDRRESYDGEYDWSYTFGQCPGYMYYGASPGVYGRWNRFNHQSGRFSPCGMVNGGWRVQFPYPIVPGDRCYFSLDDASSVNYQKQLWFVPSISVPREINKKHFVTRVAKKYQSPNRNNATENPILTDAKVDRVFHSASKPWTSNFMVSGSTWNLKAPTDVWAYMPFSFKLGQGTRGSSGWDVNQQYWLMNTTQLNPWKRMWWRNGGTYILRFIPAREIDDVIAEIAASSNAKYLDNHYDGSITKNTIRGWLNACKDRWVICNWTVYRKKVGGVEWWEKHGHLRESDYDSTNGDAAWSYWQNICLVSKEAGLICPPINHKNGVCRWNAGYALRNTALDTLPQLNWVGCGAKDTFGVADADKSGGIDYTTILNHQEKYRASYMSAYEVWEEKYKFWK